MKRTPEPELMLEREQAAAYANADFSEAHQRFVDLFAERFADRPIQGAALDLGCGPGDVACRFAARFPETTVYGVDGSQAMLEAGESLPLRRRLGDRVRLFQEYLPSSDLPLTHFDLVISNSLLHHLADPSVLWQTAVQYGAPGAPLFVMDLRRPDDANEVERLVELYVANEPEVLRLDFRNSLHAAYTPEEVQRQLRQAGLASLQVEVVSDRHLIVWGDLPG